MQIYIFFADVYVVSEHFFADVYVFGVHFFAGNKWPAGVCGGRQLCISVVLEFHRWHVESAKKGCIRELLSGTYCVGEQVVIYNNTIVLIFCVLRRFRRRITEGSPRGR